MITAEILLELSNLGLSSEQLSAVLRILSRIEMVIETQREKNKTRQSRYRLRHRNVTRDVTETEKVSPSLSPTPPITTLSKNPPLSPKKGTRIPEEWEPSQDNIAWAINEMRMDRDQIREATVEFRDYWTAVPGHRGCKLNWGATWRNSVRRFLERKKIVKLRPENTTHWKSIQPGESRAEWLKRINR